MPYDTPDVSYAEAPEGPMERPVNLERFAKAVSALRDTIAQLEDNLSGVLTPDTDADKTSPREAPFSKLGALISAVEEANNRLRSLRRRVDV